MNKEKYFFSKNLAQIILVFFLLLIFHVLTVPAQATQDLNILYKKVADLKAHYSNITIRSSGIGSGKVDNVNKLRSRKAINTIRIEISRLEALIKELEEKNKQKASQKSDTPDPIDPIDTPDDQIPVNQNSLDMMDIDNNDSDPIVSNDNPDTADDQNDSTIIGDDNDADNTGDSDNNNQVTAKIDSETLNEFEVFTDEGAILKVPEYYQIDAENEAGYDTGTLCGPTSLSMLLDFHGVDNTIGDMASRVYVKGSGSSADTLVKEAKLKGFDKARYEVGKDLEFVEKSIRAGKPFIANIIDPTSGNGHYVVVIGITGDKVIINDPITSGIRLEWTRDEFMKAWKGRSCRAIILEKSSVEPKKIDVQTDNNTDDNAKLNDSVPDNSILNDLIPNITLPATSQPAITQASNVSSKRVLCLGDSITAHGGYINRLKELSNNKIEFVKAATVGHKTSQMLKRITDPTAEGYVKLSEYDTIIVMGGVNNIWAGEKSIKDDLTQIFTIAKRNLKAPAKIIMLTILPYKGYSTWKSSYHDTILNVNDYFKKNSKGLIDNVVDTFKVLSDPSDQQRMFPDFTSDKLHPNNTGHKKMGELIYDQVFRKP